MSIVNIFLHLPTGTDMSGQLIGRYCGDTKPDELSVPYRTLFIQFRSDSTETRPGFKMFYEASGRCKTGRNSCRKAWKGVVVFYCGCSALHKRADSSQCKSVWTSKI